MLRACTNICLDIIVKCPVAYISARSLDESWSIFYISQPWWNYVHVNIKGHTKLFHFYNQTTYR